MALLTKCPKANCNSTSFELATQTKVKGANHNIFFIQCSLCGAAVSAIDARHDHIITEMAKKLGIR